MAGRLEGKVALVTGASSGIGEATAVALAAEGAKVALAARRQDRLEALERKLARAVPRRRRRPLDVTDEQACRDAVSATRDRLGGLDIVINNAGLMLLGPILDADTEDWRRMIHTNVLGLMYLTHAALPHLVGQGSGDIVNISSVAGRVARLGSGVYNASKWGVNAFTESLRQEVTERGVRVSVVEPGSGRHRARRPHHATPEAKAATKQWKASIRSLQRRRHRPRRRVRRQPAGPCRDQRGVGATHRPGPVTQEYRQYRFTPPPGASDLIVVRHGESAAYREDTAGAELAGPRRPRARAGGPAAGGTAGRPARRASGSTRST